MKCAVAMVVAIGCGGGNPSQPGVDAADADAASDAPDATPTGTVSVTVRQRTYLGFAANVPVVFSDPGGATTEVRTDANGHAEAAVSAGASVTVQFDLEGHLATVVGVKPGDQLTFGNGRLTSLEHPFTVSFTAFDPQATYALFTPCFAFSVTPPVTTVNASHCNGPTTNTDVYIVATVAGVPAASAAAHGVDLTSGAIAVTDPWTPMKTLQLGFPAGAGNNVAGYFGDMPQNYNVGGSFFDAPITLRVPTAGTVQLVHTDVENGSIGSQTVLERITPATTSYTLDTSLLRPWIQSAAYDVATRKVSSEAPGLTGELVKYEIMWGSPYPSDTWEVFAPSFGSVVLPALPADIQDPGAFAGAQVYVTLYDNSTYASWDAVRPHVYDLDASNIDPAGIPDRRYWQLFMGN